MYPFLLFTLEKQNFKLIGPPRWGKNSQNMQKLNKQTIKNTHTHKHKKNSTCLIVRQNRQYVCIYSIIRIKKRKYHHIHILLRTLHDLHHERIWKKMSGRGGGWWCRYFFCLSKGKGGAGFRPIATCIFCNCTLWSNLIYFSFTVKGGGAEFPDSFNEIWVWLTWMRIIQYLIIALYLGK